MVHKCVILGCRSKRYPGCPLIFHSFPKDSKRRTQWLSAVKLKNKFYETAKICSNHFVASDYMEDRLKHTAIPFFSDVPEDQVPPRIAPVVLRIVPENFGGSANIIGNIASNTVEVDANDLPPKKKLCLREILEENVKSESPDVETSCNLSECFDETASSGEVLACRVCLATDGRLYAISGSGLEDALAALTGVAFSEEQYWPRHLCVICRAKLSNCVAFRDSCQRTTALLQSLLEKGPLQMNDIKALNRKSQKLVNKFTCCKNFQFGTNPFIEIIPEIKTVNNENTQDEADYTAVEYLEEDFLKYDANDVDMRTLELPVENLEIAEIRNRKIKVEEETESPNTYSEIHNYIDIKVKSVMSSDVDTDTLEETLAAVKKSKGKRVKLEKENNIAELPNKYKNVKSKVDGYPADIASDISKKTRRLRKKIEIKFDTESFEKKHNCKIKVLSIEEQKQRVEKRKRNNKSAYSCHLCGKGFLTERTLTKHKTCHDPSLPAECDVCLFRFRSQRFLRDHQRGHCTIFTCNECGDVSRTRTQAKCHFLMHQGTTYTCPYCQAVYNHPTSYYNHIRMQHPGQYEACDLCGETFAAGRGIIMHKRLAHKQLAQRKAEQHPLQPLDQHHCDECNKTFSNAASFALHAARKHANRRASKAPFRPRPELRRDRPRPAAGRVRPRPAQTLASVCEICGKAFNCMAVLGYHMNQHLGLKPFQCPHCPKAFSHKTNCRIHMRVHSERRYQCEQCPRAFTQVGNLMRHVNSVHLQEKAKCQICGKVMSVGWITSHVRAVHLKQPYRKLNRTKKLDRVTES